MNMFLQNQPPAPRSGGGTPQASSPANIFLNAPTNVPVPQFQAPQPNQTQQPQAQPTLLQQAEQTAGNFGSQLLGGANQLTQSVSNIPIVGDIAKAANSVVQSIPQVPSYVEEAVKNPLPTLAGGGAAVLKFGGSLAGIVEHGVASVLGTTVPDRLDITKQTQALGELNTKILQKSGVDEQKAFATGQFLGAMIPYTLGGELVGATIGAKILAPLASKFLPLATKLIPTISDAIGFLGVGQIEHDNNIDGTRINQLKNDLTMLTLFKITDFAIGGAGKLFSPETKDIVSKTVDDTSSQFKSGQSVELQPLEHSVEMAKQAITQDTGKIPAVLIADAIQKNKGDLPFKWTKSPDAVTRDYQILNQEGGTPVLTPKPSKVSEYLQHPQNDVQLKNNDYISQNFDKAKADYTKRVVDEYGTPYVITADEAKYVIPDYAAEKAPDYHEAASALSKSLYDEYLQERKGKGNNTVLFSAGGTGVGKTTALRDAKGSFSDYSIIYDTNLTGDNVLTKVQKALSNGYKVDVNFVYRDPINSFENGVLPRVKSRGRIVTIDEHIARHEQALDSIKRVQEHFGDKVNVGVIDNNGAKGQARVTTLDNLPSFEYNKDELRKVLEEKTNEAQANGTITQSEANAIKGIDFSAENGGQSQQEPNVTNSLNAKENTAETKVVSETQAGQGNNPQNEGSQNAKDQSIQNESNQTTSSQQELQTSSLALSVEKTAIEKKLVKDLGTLPEYEKMDMSEQASKAADLLTNDPQTALQVAMGETPPPDGLLAESVFKAMEASVDSPELARKLATSPLVSEASKMGQRIKALDVKTYDSPVEAIKQVIDARAKALKDKTGMSLDEAVLKTRNQIKNSVKLPDKGAWKKFIDAIEC